MSCCGDRRRSLSKLHAKPVQVPDRVFSSQSIAYASPQGQVRAATAPMFVRYAGNASVVVRGPVTNRQYSFQRRGSVQSVDARDAMILLRDERFNRG